MRTPAQEAQTHAPSQDSPGMETPVPETSSSHQHQGRPSGAENPAQPLGGGPRSHSFPPWPRASAAATAPPTPPSGPHARWMPARPALPSALHLGLLCPSSRPKRQAGGRDQKLAGGVYKRGEARGVLGVGPVAGREGAGTRQCCQPHWNPLLLLHSCL